MIKIWTTFFIQSEAVLDLYYISTHSTDFHQILTNVIRRCYLSFAYVGYNRTSKRKKYASKELALTDFSSVLT